MPKTIHTKQYKMVVDKIKKARLESGFTQKQVAEKIKQPQSYISKIESGEQRMDIVELQNLAKLYKRSLEYFLGNK